MQTQHTSHKVAVIGAGAAGLVAARELRREGHQVVAFERNNRVGGTWVYDALVEFDPLGTQSSRTTVYTSLYDSLRTNLPREVMGFRDFPFVSKPGVHRDPRRFPGHREVLHYLEDFASEFELHELIRFDTEVDHVGLIKPGKWAIRSKKRSGDGDVAENEVEIYDAVVVCNGHYTKPNIADIPGISLWPGKQVHSRNYRVPDPFYKKVVVLIGHSHSGYDISRDIARVAKEVHVASKSTTNSDQSGYDNLWLHSMVRSAHEDGTILFQDGSSVLADVILHCTGYKYDFPFLKTSDYVSVDDNRVSPLYQHIFPPQFAPWLSFVGLGLKILPFFLCELQSKWIARILSGRISLPSQDKMISHMEELYSKLKAAGVPKRYTHNIKDYQFDYYDWVAGQCGVPPFEKWRLQIYAATGKNRVARPEMYRDEWDDQDLIVEAHQDFLQYMPKKDGENYSEFKQNASIDTEAKGLL